MSYYTRPESPPPRAPSPEPVHTPLPSPHLRARDRLRPRTSSPLVPPGLIPPRTLVQSRSCEQLFADPAVQSSSHPTLTFAEPQTLRRRVRSNLEYVQFEPLPSNSPHASSPSPSPARIHRRTLSVSVHPSPNVSPSIPPVPPLPESARSSPKVKDSAVHVTPIFLPDLHELSPISERTSSERKPLKRPSLISLSGISRSSGSPSPTEKRNIGMTCLKFFSLHKSSSRLSLRSGTASSQ